MRGKLCDEDGRGTARSEGHDSQSGSLATCTSSTSICYSVYQSRTKLRRLAEYRLVLQSWGNSTSRITTLWSPVWWRRHKATSCMQCHCVVRYELLFSQSVQPNQIKSIMWQANYRRFGCVFVTQQTNRASTKFRTSKKTCERQTLERCSANKRLSMYITLKAHMCLYLKNALTNFDDFWHT